MAKLALTRLAGTIAATALCAAAATEATAQSSGQNGGEPSNVLNSQINLSDPLANQTLVVATGWGSTQASAMAQGNSAAGGTDGVDLMVTSDQVNRGNVTATTTIQPEGETWGHLGSTTMARANYLSVTSNDANLGVNARQTAADGRVHAVSVLDYDDARLHGGAHIDASAAGNVTALGATALTSRDAGVYATVDQNSTVDVQAHNTVNTRYIPGQSVIQANAAANQVTAFSGSNTNQDIVARQQSHGGLVEAEVSANAANAWDLAGRARASANQAVFNNRGGSLVVATDQDNRSYVRAASTVTAYDFGAANSYARAAGNEVEAGNQDLYVQIDNTQINSGGVIATATFTGMTGYDAYVGADAVGNSVVGYSCAGCNQAGAVGPGVMNVNNNQTNTASVTAQTQTIVNGSGRHTIVGTNATGNSATFFVSRPNGY